MKLIFIRHAEPDYSIDSLTEKGFREAEILSKRVVRFPYISQIFCSPLGRAKDTASFSLKALKQEAVTFNWLREFSYLIPDPQTGKRRIPWDFMPDFWTKYSGSYDKDNWLSLPFIKDTELPLRYKEVTKGFDEILASYGYHRDGKIYKVDHSVIETENEEDTLVFFCHLGVSFVIIGYLLGISPFLLWHTAYVAPTSITILGTEEREPGIASFRIQTLGDTKHLADAGEPISSSGYFTDSYQY